MNLLTFNSLNTSKSISLLTNIKQSIVNKTNYIFNEQVTSKILYINVYDLQATTNNVKLNIQKCLKCVQHSNLHFRAN